MCIWKDYVKKLIELFHMVQDLESEDDLESLFHIFKSLSTCNVWGAKF